MIHPAVTSPAPGRTDPRKLADPGRVAARTGRHLSTDAPLRWNVDHLKAISKPVEIWWTNAPDEVECRWAMALASLPEFACPAPVRGQRLQEMLGAPVPTGRNAVGRDVRPAGRRTFGRVRFNLPVAAAMRVTPFAPLIPKSRSRVHMSFTSSHSTVVRREDLWRLAPAEKELFAAKPIWIGGLDGDPPIDLRRVRAKARQYGRQNFTDD
jgi:hypothetical protein